MFAFFFPCAKPKPGACFVAGASSSLASRRETSEGGAQMINRSCEKKKRAKRKRCWVQKLILDKTLWVKAVQWRSNNLG